MAFLDRVLDPPSYGWTDKNGELVKPSAKQLWAELFSRINIFQSRKNWLALTNWVWTIMLAPFVVLFVFYYFSPWLLLAGFLYSMVGMGTHGTIWYHRYCTHRAYTFSHPFWRLVTRNLMIKVVPEEIYVVSHHVHHAKSEQPGDPYNALAGGLYCFLADTNHQPIAKDLSRQDYERIVGLLKHTGVKPNTYEQYQKWGTVAHPFRTYMHQLLNWGFWYGAFFLMGGHALATTFFAGACIWAVGIRTFNYDGHGKGTDVRQDGVDFNRRDLSVNQYWAGYVAGEWHNNHHLYPNSARSGFLPHQFDLAWVYVWILYKIGAVSSYRDSKANFYEKYYLPYIEKQKLAKEASTDASDADALDASSHEMNEDVAAAYAAALNQTTPNSEQQPSA